MDLIVWRQLLVGEQCAALGHAWHESFVVEELKSVLHALLPVYGLVGGRHRFD